MKNSCVAALCAILNHKVEVEYNHTKQFNEMLGGVILCKRCKNYALIDWSDWASLETVL